MFGIYYSSPTTVATELLTNSLLPVVEIANHVGFNNLSNFNRQFKQYYHTTPSQYRKQLRKNRAYTTFDK